MGQPSVGDGGNRIQHLCSILTPSPSQVGLHSCTSNVAGSTPSSPVGAAAAFPGARGKYLFTPRQPPAATQHALDTAQNCQVRIGLSVRMYWEEHSNQHRLNNVFDTVH